MVYFVQSVNGGPIKIGTTENIDVRLKQLETTYGQSLAVLATMEGDRATEREVHERFAHLRFGRTEQFRPGADLMAFIGRPLLVGVNPRTVEAMTPSTRTLVNLQGGAAYAEWFAGLIAYANLPATVVTELAIRAFAKSQGFDEPQPKR